MGKGDRRTAKGKRYNSSYGNARTHSPATAKAAGPTSPVVKKTATKTAKAPARKVVAKKAGKE